MIKLNIIHIPVAVTLIFLLGACDPESIDIDPDSASAESESTSTAENNNEEVDILSLTIANNGAATGTRSDPLIVNFETAFDIFWEINSLGDNSITFELLSADVNITETLGEDNNHPRIMHVPTCSASGSCNDDFMECATTYLSDITPTLKCEYSHSDSGVLYGYNVLFEKLPTIDTTAELPQVFQIVAQICSTASEFPRCDIQRAGYVEIYAP